VRFHGSFSFKYSDRPHTRSIDFDEKIPEALKSSRLATFQKRQDEICLERNSEYIGMKLEIMVESMDRGALQGRTATNHIVHCENNEAVTCLPGDLLTVQIDHAGKHSLKGKLHIEH